MANNTPEVFLENLKTELIDIWSRPEVIAELGSEAVALSRVAEGLFVPAFRKGKFRMPSELEDTESVSVLLMPPDRDVVIHETLLRSTPNQRRQIEKIFIERILTLKTQAGFDADREAVLATSCFEGMSSRKNTGNSSFLTFNSRFASLGTEESIFIRGRPVILHCLDYEVKSITSRDLHWMAHEIEHARQILDEPAQVFRAGSMPIEKADDTARNELLAYRVGLVTATASDHLGRHWSDPSLLEDNLHLWPAYQIESARIRHGNGPDSFDVTRSMAAAIHRQNLLHALVY